MRRPHLLTSTLALGIAALVTSGCLSSGSEEGDGGAATGEVSGSTVTIWTSTDEPTVKGLSEALKKRTDPLGVTVKWERVDNINQLIMTKIQAGDVPDIAMIPQPGVVGDIVKRGKAFPLEGAVDVEALRQEMIPGTLEAGTFDGKLYGVMINANGKSFVYYPKKAWDQAGYEAPQSLAELEALTEKIKADGTATAPWCMGIGSEASTGWPATDWFEDLVMRFGTPDDYNKWVRNEIKFDSPLVRQAAAQYEKLLFTEGNVLGGRKSIASTAFGAAGTPMFDAKPGCMLYKQGSFITTFFPKKVQDNLNDEVGVFAFPPATAGGPNPFLGGGDQAIILKNTAGAQAVLKELATTEVGQEAVEATGAFLSPFKNVPLDSYKGQVNQDVAEIAYSTSQFLFDGSDAMPGAVGAGTFWKEMTAWNADQQSLDETLKNIDDSWPTS